MKKLLSFLFVLLIAQLLHAQRAPLDSARFHKKYWSVETSIVWPVYPGIFKLNFVREAWSKKGFSGEVGLGLNIQPERTNDEGSFSEEFITLFYRQYFWKGLHVQIEHNFAYGRIRGYPGDPAPHESFAIFHDFCAGYKFTLLKKHKVGISLIPQAGGGFTGYVNDAWPRPEPAYWLVNVLAGITF